MKIPLVAMIVSTTTLATSAEPTSKPAGDRKAVKFVLDPSKPVYKVGVNYAYQTTIRTPGPCGAPAVGDPDKFAVLVPDKSGRRFIVTAAVQADGATTNVTFECDDGVLFTLEVT